MARPKSTAETRREQIGVRVTPTLKAAAEKAAAQDRRTLSQWAELLFETELKARGLLED